MREKLAKTLFDHDIKVLEEYHHGNAKWETASPERKTSYLAQVDAILDALMEPSEKMINAALFHAFVHDDNRARRAMIFMWKAMLRAAKEE